MSEPTDKREPDPGGAFTPQQAFEFMQRMWNPLGVPMPGFAPAPPSTAAAPDTPPAAPGLGFPNPATMFAALDPAEVERKIQELRIVENWLSMTLGMMQMSIKTLELQKASLEALRGAAAPRSDDRPASGRRRKS